MNNDNDDISSLLDELSSFELPTHNTEKAAKEENNLKIEDLQQFVLNKSKTLVETGVGAVQDLAGSVVAGGDAREIEALSKLMTSAAQAIDALQRTSLIDRKADRDEQLEKLKLQGKKELAEFQQGPQKITNNNILVASTEDIMKRLSSGKDGVLNVNQ